MLGTDIFPSRMGAFLESRLGYDVALTRPPLYLLGGDFLPVDARSALVSAITLEENGGRATHLSAVFKEYFGVEKVLYLENLPGDTIEHLDFIVQPIAPNVILAATPPETFGHDRPFHRYLNGELSQRLLSNRERLAATFPKARIVDVPMPPPLLDSDEDVVRELIFHCVDQIAANAGLPFWSAGGLEALEPRNVDPKLEAAVQREFGVLDWRDPSRQRAAAEKYLGRPIAELISRHVEEHVSFRSYINSLYLRTAATEIVLVPRYRAANAGESALIDRLEREVQAAYKKALPNAEFRWIDCTSLVDLLGAVHCLTATIPDSKP
jgi:agmatine/peptidylarginine deiminase